jgi:hypothetical protein
MGRPKKKQDVWDDDVAGKNPAAKSAPPPAMGGNIGPLLKRVNEAATKVSKLKEKRSEINAQISEVRASLATQGIPKWAFDASLAYMEADIEKRQGFDEGYQIAREAMGLPVKGTQIDMFGADGKTAASATAKGEDENGETESNWPDEQA